MATPARAALLLGLLLVAIIPTASAELGMSSIDNHLNLSCVSDDECSLSNIIIGEESISKQESQASPVQPKTVNIEFNMDPDQRQLALLPDTLDELVIDLRVQEDVLGWNKPDLLVTLRLGENLQQWNIEGSGPAAQVTPTPYKLTDEPLELESGRILRPDDIVQLRITFELDRPSNWELFLQDSSYFDLDIEWSVDVDAENVDEPTSDEQPRSIQNVESLNRGALVDGDRDCFKFELPEHEAFSITITWGTVPIEVEQPHDPPEIRNYANIRASVPEIRTTHDGSDIEMILTYRGLDTDEYTACWGGMPGRFQAYEWYGRMSYEGIGPTDPSQFTKEATYNSGPGTLADRTEAVVLEPQGSGSLILGLILLCLITGAVLMMPTTRFRATAFSIATILILIGGVLDPVFTFAEEGQMEEEMDIGDLFEQRLEGIWEVSVEGYDGTARSREIGATFGLQEGEELQLMLEVDETSPLPEEMWQLHSTDLDNVRIDKLVFDHLAAKGVVPDSEGMMPQQAVNFILHAGRALTLDLLILEALLVIDYLPQGTTAHIDWVMVGTPSTGPPASPAWSTRPSSIEMSEWSNLQRVLYPTSMAVSYCDCGLDMLDFTWTPSKLARSDDLVSPTGLEGTVGITTWDDAMLGAGAMLVLLVALVETRRRKSAHELAMRIAYGEDGW